MEVSARPPVRPKVVAGMGAAVAVAVGAVQRKEEAYVEDLEDLASKDFEISQLESQKSM